MVLFGVLRRIDERDIAFCEIVAEFFDESLRFVARFEFVEIVRCESLEWDAARMVELAELRRRRDFLCPGIEPCAFLLHAARPETVDEDAAAVAFFGRIINAFRIEDSHS